MIENHAGSNDRSDVSDHLEAFGVFKGWKNFWFLIVLLCLLLLQVSFYLVDRGYIKVDGKVYADEPAKETVVEPNEPNEPGRVVEPNAVAEPSGPVEPNEPIEPDKPAEDAEPVEPNEPAEPNEPDKPAEDAEPV